MTVTTPPIRLSHLTKHFGGTRAVDDLSVDIAPARITAFLGPNGAGKSTTVRMLLGLVEPTSGEALIQGRRYRDLPEPRHVVGAVLETEGFHPGRRGRDHLRVLGRSADIPDRRVDEVLELVGLTAAAGRRVGDYSLGMRQRLALAAAVLADPEVLVLDEPANGLDPEGVAWLRRSLRQLATDRGTTVLMSSHLLSEVSQTVDDVVVLHRGTLRYAGALEGLTGPGGSLEEAFLDLTSDTEGLGVLS